MCITPYSIHCGAFLVFSHPLVHLLLKSRAHSFLSCALTLFITHINTSFSFHVLTLLFLAPTQAIIHFLFLSILPFLTPHAPSSLNYRARIHLLHLTRLPTLLNYRTCAHSLYFTHAHVYITHTLPLMCFPSSTHLL